MSAQDGAATPPTDLVTLIITTSPTPSAPSTDLISNILSSFKLHCPALLSCRIIVVFDTYDRIGECMRLKKGQITAEGARAVELYKLNIKDLILKEWYPEEKGASRVLVHGQALAEFGSPCLVENHVALSTSQTDDGRVAFIEPAARLGFGLAVRSALRMAETPYVWVQQHDWPLVRDIPLGSLLEVMQASEGDSAVPVKYICLPAIRMLSYATSAHVEQFPTLRTLTAELKRDFKTSRPEVVVPLTPLFFWHDKPHIASTAHYLARVFPTRLAIARGDFIEDSIGQRARTQMKDGNWVKWACWLYCPGDGREVCLQHRHGRKWRGVEAEMQEKAMFLEMRSKQSSPLPAP
ncbi:hypothetical protein E0Z10_g1291 [Xylaria hypoxylon]|uniref:Uncharacterized protein n=1 Tax=Xylaria hypoxylon TaxID=37992 RepID=A0A4Z0Z7P1_9PEZI|nr:hypothetical protein E0Z10_g1291 [Xylaria hypoxylon]